MTEPQLLLGSEVAESIYSEIRSRLKEDVKPFLVVIQVGDDPASGVYIKYKRLACEKLGFGFELRKFHTEISTEELHHEIMKINDDEKVTGCIVQLPLPAQIDQMKILNSIKPEKDVDCFSYENIGKMYYQIDIMGHVPATAWGIMRMIQHYKIETKGKVCVILGKSVIVGRPLSLMLGDETGPACTVVSCDRYTDPEVRASLTKIADIVIVATGVHHLIKNPDELKQGCVVIDVGIHPVGQKDGKRVVEGDVDFDKVKKMCSWITPVPGGVGPTTVATLMWNLARPYFV